MGTDNQILSYLYSFVGSFWIMLFEVIFIGIFFSRSVAEQTERREILTLFSHPIKRTTVLLAKYLTNMLIILLIMSASIIVYGLFMGFGPFHPLPYITILLVLIQLVYFSGISLTCSVLTKSSWASIIVPIVVLFALLFIQVPQGSLYYYFSPFGSQTVIYNYLVPRLMPAQFPHGSAPFGKASSTPDFLSALFIPITIGIVLLAISFIYFRFMEVD